MNNKKNQHNTGNWQIPIAITCMLLGIVVTMQFKMQEKAGFPQLSNNRNDMIKMVHELEFQKNKLEKDLEQKKKELSNFEQAAGSKEDILKAMQNQLDAIRTEAGYTDVKGPGIIVELSDSAKRPAPKDDPFFFIVHDVDIATLVNELWASGAEAISVNGQRIVVNTAIRCVGPTILINSVRLASPYKVIAIGPSKDLEGALKTPGGFVDYMTPSTNQGVNLSINKYDNLEISGFKGSMILRYAVPTGAEK
ncbi:DUF881 domain-containing protein [bacterium]|nr:DUF881 domain-containing protein [bacterium]